MSLQVAVLVPLTIANLIVSADWYAYACQFTLAPTPFDLLIWISSQNAFVGWYQEKAAGDIVEQLKSGIALRATVIRNGQEHEMEAREIVPGDIVIIEVRSHFSLGNHSLNLISAGRPNDSRRWQSSSGLRRQGWLWCQTYSTRHRRSSPPQGNG